MGQDRLVAGRPCGHIDGENLAQAFAEARRIGLEGCKGQGLAVRAPAGLAGFPDRAEDLTDLTGGDLHRVQGSVLVEEGDEGAIPGPGG